MNPTSDTYARVMGEFEKWTETARYCGDADVSPLVKSAAAHLKSEWKRRAVGMAELGPTLAILYFAAEEFDYSILKRWATRLCVWVFRHRIAPGRALWNDFHMCLWMLSRDPRYVARLHSHLKHANAIQLETGHWMITSVCYQDEEFREHWTDIVRERGEVFA